MFLDIFASVLDAYFKCFICFQTYVAIVASGCFKTRSSVASPSSPFLLSHLGVRHGKAEAVPTGTGRPHMLAGGRSRRDVSEQARDAGQGAAAQGIQTGGASVRTSGR